MCLKLRQRQKIQTNTVIYRERGVTYSQLNALKKFSWHSICLIMGECACWSIFCSTVDVLSHFVFMKHNMSIYWVVIYLSLPLTSVAAVPFAIWTVAGAVPLLISWSTKLSSGRPALQVVGVWPHSSVTSVRCSLAETERRKGRIKKKRNWG